MKIRRISVDEQLTRSATLQAYGFQSSPANDSTMDRLRESQRYYKDNVTFVVEDNGVTLAEASAIPMQQNIRNSVYPMAGVAGVATQPFARRRGHVKALLIELLGQMRETGHVLSALYPFRPSFYQRFGYVGVPKTRTVRFSPVDLASLLRAELVGDISWERAGNGYDAYRHFTQRLLIQRHGFALLPDYRSVQLRDAEDRWLVTARLGDEVVGAVTYRITHHGGDLVTDDLLITSPLSRTLLLKFFACHVDQVARVVTTVAPNEIPELWATDLSAVTETKISFPTSPAPMARVLSLDALTGMPTGPGRVEIEIVDDPFIAGRYVLDGMAGILDVSHGQVPAPTAKLTSAGLSGLVYGVLGPEDVVVRELGDIPRDAADQLRSLFPEIIPHFFASF
jgi:predicted N-acetyltransferase YhbS